MTFSVSEWLKEALISGVQRGTLAREFVVTRTVDYLVKGILDSAQVEEIAVGIAPVVEPEQGEEVPEVTSE